MILGKIVGTVVTTLSHPDYKNRRLLVVQPLGLEDEPPDEAFLVNREGSGARQVLNNPDACVISVIVGIVDSVTLA